MPSTTTLPTSAFPSRLIRLTCKVRKPSSKGFACTMTTGGHPNHKERSVGTLRRAMRGFFFFFTRSGSCGDGPMGWFFSFSLTNFFHGWGTGSGVDDWLEGGSRAMLFQLAKRRDFSMARGRDFVNGCIGFPGETRLAALLCRVLAGYDARRPLWVFYGPYAVPRHCLGIMSSRRRLKPLMAVRSWWMASRLLWPSIQYLQSVDIRGICTEHGCTRQEGGNLELQKRWGFFGEHQSYGPRYLSAATS
ncbi:hypothetical protein F4861DRAFT_510975 [Xylaria intraflava]|nr:hypothetical protein F4861DRAFT_510975 [Xylaria intraflava]